MIVACGFGCSIAGSARASILLAVFAVLGFWLAAAAVGYQQPGATRRRKPLATTRTEVGDEIQSADEQALVHERLECVLAASQVARP
jgi:hypothetical protein